MCVCVGGGGGGGGGVECLLVSIFMQFRGQFFVVSDYYDVVALLNTNTVKHTVHLELSEPL